MSATWFIVIALFLFALTLGVSYLGACRRLREEATTKGVQITETAYRWMPDEAPFRPRRGEAILRFYGVVQETGEEITGWARYSSLRFDNDPFELVFDSVPDASQLSESGAGSSSDTVETPTST